MDCDAEIEALQAIYPELVLTGQRSGTMEFSVSPVEPTIVNFIDESGNLLPEKCIQIEHLPPVEFTFNLPDGYPEEAPAELDLKSMWLAPDHRDSIISRATDLWTDLCKDYCLYSIMDMITESFSAGFNFQVVLPLSARSSIESFDKETREQKFFSQPLKCEICQYVKRGALCTKLSICSHVYCTECLVDYFSACIDQGYISQVKCPQMSCRQVPSDEELIKLVGDDLFTRYKTIKSKLKVDSEPTRYLFCPREACQGLIERNPDDLLTICPKCNFAFCFVCKRSWHGYYEYCRVQEPSLAIIEGYINGDTELRLKLEREWGKNNMQLYVRNFEAEKSFRQYMEENRNMACPKCTAPIERSMGCNKMVCSICNTFFCFLCGECLSRSDPYKHYSAASSPCFQKLFDGTIEEPEEIWMARLL